jgi:hypothetical protein
MNKRKLLTAGAVAMLLSATMAWGGIALASTPAGLFELEGNATSDSGAGKPDDWDRVCYEQAIKDGLTSADATTRCTSPDPTHGATAVAWTTDTHGAIGPLGACTGSNCTIFTGGGSKDPIDINQWAWKDNVGGLPDKDNLLHGFAARYSIDSSAACPGKNPDGTANTDGTAKCEMLFFGNDRFDNSGDAQQGFWFFQNKIGLGTNAVGGGNGFTSSGGTEFHRKGDLLLISDFSNGGSVSTITVFTWDPDCKATSKTPWTSGVSCGDANLRFQASSTAANCNPVDPAISGFCGIVNPADNTLAPWSFTDKTTTNSTTHLPNTYLQGELYEGGVNLSYLNLGGECFSSIASETRSSQSTTAVLKDFVLGSFGDCDSTFSTTASISAPTPIPANGLLTVSDSATLTVKGVSTWSGTVDFYLCGPAASAGTCTSATGTKIGSTINVNQGTAGLPTITSASTTVSSVGTYCWAGVFTSNTNGVPSKSDNTASECFSVTPLTPTIPTTASGTVVIGNPVSDSAALSGTAHAPGATVIGGSAGAAAGGTITFKLYGPSDTAVCTASNLVFTSSAIPVSGDGTYGSGNYTPTSAGTYRWIASYTGDSPNTNGVTGACGDSNESVVVNPKTPTIVTNAVAGPVSLGSAISDTATIGNTANKPNGDPAGGTVTFKAYGPSATAVCTTANLVFTSSAIPVSGNGTYGSGNYTPTSAGTYWWIATYTGDSPNTSGPVSTACGDENESSVVQQLQPEISTAQTFTVKDSATITVASGAGDLAGSVRFQLFNNDTCAPGAGNVDRLYDSGAVALSGASPQTVESGTTTITTSKPVLSWLVEYTSTNQGHKNVTSTCNTENASLLISNHP